MGNPVAKTDYAVNLGDPNWKMPLPGPTSFAEFDQGTFEYPDVSDRTGISFDFSKVRVQQITDGLSHTYMLGEKNLNADKYTTGSAIGDDQTLYNGTNQDLARTTHPNFGPPRQDRPGLEIAVFGSPHAAGCNFAMCDGSVRTISYDIAPDTHRRFGNRQDGLSAAAEAD
jgi:prepilin-type processing-associated H-X9-DG protein